MAKKKTMTKEFTETAHDVWLAGLGALAAAGEEGEKLFRTLVDRGRKVEKKVVRPVDDAGSRLKSTVKEVQSRASESIGSIQSAIDDSVAAALHRFGVPTRDEISKLSSKVEKLTREVDGRGARKTRTRAVRKAAKRTTARKTTAKRRAVKKSTAKRRTAKRAAS